MTYSPRFDAALIYATHVHAGQVRKTTRAPYISHLLAIAALVAENGGDEEQVIAALLHDAPEDQGGEGRLDDIRMRFGEAVAKVVADCSDTFASPKPPWRQRKEHYLAHLESVEHASLLVSLADKVHNSRAIVAELRQSGDATFDHFNGKKAGTLWYYRTLVDIFGRRFPGPLTDELSRTVREMLLLAGEGGT
jgi:(p)ppGpp synthase/HD superfamily hydrolase